MMESSDYEKIKHHLTLLMSCVNFLKEFNEEYSDSYKSRMLKFGEIFDFHIPPIVGQTCNVP